MIASEKYNFSPKHDLEHYQKKSEKYANFAHFVCGVKFDADTKSYLSEIMHLARGIDNGIDVLPTSILKVQLTEILNNTAELVIGGKYPHLASKNLDFLSSQAEKMQGIIECNIIYRSTSDYNQYRSSRINECVIFEDMVLAGFSSDVTNQNKFGYFENIFRRTSRSAQLINSARGLKEECHSHFLNLSYRKSLEANLYLNGVSLLFFPNKMNSHDKYLEVQH